MLELSIPRETYPNFKLSLSPGQQVFIVGPNGAGKSALIHCIDSGTGGQQSVRIAAHRQTWLQSSRVDMTAESRENARINRSAERQDINSIWNDRRARERLSSLLFDLVSNENLRARSIASFVDKSELAKSKTHSLESPSPFEQLNSLLALGTLKVSIQYSNRDEILAQHQDSETKYSMMQMSDGERNAALIAASVITAEAGTVFLIDEPERHLHRSIIEPFLSALYRHRNDCIFVISTHEISLPSRNQDAYTLLVRSCKWNDNRAVSWNVELLKPNSSIPEDLKRDILGSRKQILFVEGSDSGSLDLPLYAALFPSVSVIPKGGCADVIRAVQGLRGSRTFHNVEAYGLIDRDNLEENEVEQLAQRNVFALDVYSIESIYYCSDSISAVAQRQANSLEFDADRLITSAKRKALQVLKNRDLAETMAAKRCERQVRNSILSEIPDWRTIKTGTRNKINITAHSLFQDELNRYNDLVNNHDLDSLIARYPLKESAALSEISRALQLQSRLTYERTLLTQVKSDPNLASKLRDHIRPLSGKLR